MVKATPTATTQAATHLSNKALAALSSQLPVRTYAKNALIVMEGDPAEHMFFIVAGSVQAYVGNAEGDRAVLSTLGQGEYFGEMMLDGGLRSASVIALEITRLVAVSRADFREIMAQHPDIAVLLINDLIHRVRSLTQRVVNLSLMDVYGRVARLLMDSSSEDADGVRSMERLTHQTIAEQVGSSREMISRILKQLAQDKSLVITKTHFFIRKVASKS